MDEIEDEDESNGNLLIVKLLVNNDNVDVPIL